MASCGFKDAGHSLITKQRIWARKAEAIDATCGSVEASQTEPRLPLCPRDSKELQTHMCDTRAACA
jgi:hypothetical protein